MAIGLKTLLFSTLYPSSTRPGHGIFVETRLRELLRSGSIETRVIAPVPWFPSSHARFGHYGSLASTPLRETLNGIDVVHPRYLLLPKIGMNLAPLGLALGARSAVARLIDEGFDFDVIDAHYFYPDGVAAALLASWFDKPFTITARGSDLNLIGRHKLPRMMMRRAAERSGAAIGVCQYLVDVLGSWGIDPRRLHAIRNGVDLQRFHPRPPERCRRLLGITGSPVILSVGNLVDLKGHDLVIDAMPALLAAHPGAQLKIVGAGPLRQRLEAQVKRLALVEHVKFAGAVPQPSLVDWYGSADVLVLASSREGWANVLLEAMACGTPAVATAVGGTPEVLSSEVAGELVNQRDAASIGQAVLRVLERAPSRTLVRQHAELFSWDSTSQAQLQLFNGLAQARRMQAQAHA